MKFKKLKELYYSIKVLKETEKAILFEISKEKGSKKSPAPKYSTWIPKDCLGFERKKPSLLIEGFIPILEEIIEDCAKKSPQKPFNSSGEFDIEQYKESKKLPEFFDVYNSALKNGLDVQRIGSHLILKVDKESTKLKDLFVESGGGRNYNTFAQGDGDYYIFYAQFKPYFENLANNKNEK